MARIPRGIRAEAGVESAGKRVQRQASPGDLPIPGATRDPGLRVNADQFGAQIGRAVQGFAGEVGNLAAVVGVLEDKRKKAEGGIARKQAERDLRTGAAQILLEAEGDEEAAATANQRIGELAAELRIGLDKFPDQRSVYDQNAIDLVGRSQVMLVKEQHNQKVFAILRDADDLADQVHRDVLSGEMSYDAGVAELKDIRVTIESSLTADQEAQWDETQQRRLRAAAGERLLDQDSALALDGATFSPSTVFGRLIQWESGSKEHPEGNPNALGPWLTIKGSRFERERAIGLTQVIPSTADEIAAELGDENYPTGGTREEIEAYLLDEKTNIRYGMHYFKKQMRDFDGDVEAALIAYNGGPGRAQAWLAAGRDDSVIPGETRKYYKGILGRDASGGGDEVDRFFADMTVEEQIRFRDRAEAEDARRRAALSVKNQELVADVSVAVSRNELSYQEIDALRDEGVIGHPDWARFTKAKDLAEEQAGDKRRALGLARHKLQGDFREKEAAKRAALLKQEGEELSANLGVAVTLGQVDQSLLNDLRKNGRITPKRWEELTEQRVKAETKANEAAAEAKAAIAKQEGEELSASLGVAVSAGQVDQATLDDLRENGRITPVRWESLTEQLAKLDEAAAEAGISRMAAAISDARDRLFADLDVAVSRGEATQENLDALRKSGDLSDSRWATLTKRLAAVNDQDAPLIAARDRLQSGVEWVVYNSDDRAQVDLLFEASDQTDEAALALIAKTKIAPKAFVASLRQRMGNGDAKAFEIADQALAFAPQAFSHSGGDSVVERIAEFRGYTNIGFDLAEATRRASRSEEERANIAGRGEEISKELRDISLNDRLDAFAVDGFLSDLNLSEARVGMLNNDFERAYREARIDGVAAGKYALAVAAARLDMIWGLTEVSSMGGTQEMMRFPPEKFYPAGPDGHEYFREQVIARIEAETGSKPVSYRLVTTNTMTGGDVRAKQPPRYMVFFIDKDGFGQQLLTPFRAAFDDAETALTQQTKEAFQERSLFLAEARLAEIDARESQARAFRAGPLSAEMVEQFKSEREAARAQMPENTEEVRARRSAKAEQDAVSVDERTQRRIDELSQSPGSLGGFGGGVINPGRSSK